MCNEPENIELKSEKIGKEEVTPVVIAEKGECDFYTKSKNSQKVGAGASIIADDILEYQTNKIDKTRPNLTIPCLVISEDDGAEIISKWAMKGTIDKQKKPLFDISFKDPKFKEFVDLQIWYNSGDIALMQFIHEMKNYSQLLGKEIQFTPHIIIDSYEDTYITHNDDCINYAQLFYCKENSNIKQVKGKELVQMGIEEICISKQKCSDENCTSKWWDYMDNLYNCKEAIYNKACRQKARHNSSIDEKIFNDCLKKSNDIIEKQWNDLPENMDMTKTKVEVNGLTFTVFLIQEIVFLLG